MASERRLDTARVLANVLCAETPALLERAKVRPDCCIFATRLALQVLRHYGVSCFPLIVRAQVFNQAFMRRAEECGHLPRGPEELEAWYQETGAWNVGVGYSLPQAGADRWPAHLVAVLEHRFLLDLTLGQATRAQHHLYLRPLIAEVTPAFLQGKKPVVYSTDYDPETAYTDPIDGRTVTVRYERVEEEVPDYREAPDWLREHAWQPLAAEVIRRAKALVG